MHGWLRVLPVLLSLLMLPASGYAERLPIRSYSTAEGLAHNSVNRIVRDTRGFLWFATNDGLSRFDGYAFTNYSVEEGLPHRTVTDMLETRNGAFWIATHAGLVRFRPDAIDGPGDRKREAGTGRFTVVLPLENDPRSRALLSILETRDGRIFCGTQNGLFRLDTATLPNRLVRVAMPFSTHPEGAFVSDMLEDRQGALWVATSSGLFHQAAGQSFVRYGIADGLPDEFIHDLLEDRRGHLWVASRYSSFFRVSVGGHNRIAVADHYPYPERAVSTWIFRVLETSDGRFWASTSLGLMEFARSPAGGAPFLGYTRFNGLTHQEVTELAEDVGGNLWIGTATSGAMKLARNGFLTYTERDGLASAGGIFEDSAGDLYIDASVVVQPPTLPKERPQPRFEYVARRYGRLDGRAFDWFTPKPPFGWGWVVEKTIVRTTAGEWWIGGNVEGIYRYPPVRSFAAIRSAQPIRSFGVQDGLPAPQAYRLFADSRGDVWMSIISPNDHGTFRWDHATDTLHDMSELPGFAVTMKTLVRAFGEDAAGNVWVATDNGIVRHAPRRTSVFTIEEGLPPGPIVNIYTDLRGRMWLASSNNGLVRVDHPDADRPVFRTYTTAHGLSGNRIETVVGDLYGRIYAATGRGVDQLDPETGRVRHFTHDDGLAPGSVLVSYRDRTGVLWFGTQNGLSRFVPHAPEETTVPPPIVITGVTAGGEARPVSALGESEMGLPELSAGRSQFQVDFVSLRFAPGERLLYEYWLEGVDPRWSAPSPRRSVSYASLSPGRYRFLVRARNADGQVSVRPAVVTFTVLPPVWQRWWFMAIVVMAIGSALLVLHRYRIARALEIERVRTRIATDLHDDIGANLTRIAILSEVARTRRHEAAPSLDGPLSSIAALARESVTSMSDIVWAISPGRDSLLELLRRMRHHAEEVFVTRDVALSLDLPDPRTIKLAADLRRDLYLIYKEAVSNAARHSRCTAVSITVQVTNAHIVLEVCDNGIGFDAALQRGGHGLTSMQTRAGRMGGTASVAAAPSRGTSVRVVLPLEMKWTAVSLPIEAGDGRDVSV